ncbi:MAG: ketoacyl-ACP synthase III [Cytophagales bacterium]|nr:ketoacyl-ACP synthase III [Cytophagales bacterium]
MSYKVRISGVGGYVPPQVLSNKDLERIVDTSDEWILRRTGIRERRILKGKNTSYMGVQAVKSMLKSTGIDPSSVDLLICGTNTSETVFPGAGNLIVHTCGMDKASCFDLQAGCSGFLHALRMGTFAISSGGAKRAVIVGMDKMSSVVDYADRRNCVLFGDGGGCVLLEETQGSNEIVDFHIETDGSKTDLLCKKAGEGPGPFPDVKPKDRDLYFHHDGATIFKLATMGMADVCRKIVDRNNLNINQIDWLIPHQANLRILQSVRANLDLPEEKVLYNLDNYGNTSAASIPLCLWNFEKKFQPGDNILLVTFGAGLSWGVSYLRWSYKVSS